MSTILSGIVLAENPSQEITGRSVSTNFGISGFKDLSHDRYNLAS